MQATKCTSAAVETALCRRRNGTLSATKRTFVSRVREWRRLKVLCDLGVVEIVHLVHHANGRIDDGEGAKGSRALAKAQT